MIITSKEINYVSGYIKNNYYMKFIVDEKKLIISNPSLQLEMSGSSTLDIHNVLKIIEKEPYKNQEEIASALSLENEYINEILNFLESKEIIYYASSSEGYKNFDSLLSINDKRTSAQINTVLDNYSHPILLLGTTYITDKLCSVLKLNGFNVSNEQSIENLETNTLIINITNGSGFETSKWINDFLQKNNKDHEFINVVIHKNEMEISPVFKKNSSPCYECYIKRIISNKNDSSIFMSYLLNYKEPIVSNLSENFLTYNMIFLNNHIIKYLSGFSAPNVMYSETVLDYLTNEVTKNPIISVPDCEYCS